jgi:mRNA-degrading endonuclease RelE of RelBE toxin-antitoxin system
MKARPFELVYAPLLKRHLKAIEPKYYALIQEAIEEQLQTEPDVETRNRKPLKRPVFGATWEIRFGPDNRFRVLYKVDRDEWQVNILAIGEKEGERLWIGGEEIKL